MLLLSASYVHRAINTELPIELNETMFIPTLEGQATDEQQKKWLGPAKRHEIIGAYAQTEIGHGLLIWDGDDT